MNDKKYTAEEVTRKVLAKAHEMLVKYDLHKANNSHDVETGEEPSNDDAECPEFLANADIEDDGKDDEKRRKSTSSDSSMDMGGDYESDDEEGDGFQPEHEEGMTEEEDKDHDAAENEADEMDEDNIEADEEKYDDIADEDEGAKDIIASASKEPKKAKEDKKDKKFFEKSEKGLSKLEKFLKEREDKLEKNDKAEYYRSKDRKRMASPQESSSVADRMKYKRMTTPKEKADLDAKKKKYGKNKKMEKGWFSQSQELHSPRDPYQDADDDAKKKADLKGQKKGKYERYLEDQTKEVGRNWGAKRAGLDAKKKKYGKNKKMEKFLGVDSKQAKMKPQAPMEPQKPLEPKGSGMKGY